MSSRLRQLRAALKHQELDAVLVTHLPHVRYLSGFSGSSGMLLVTARRAVFFTDFRYQEQAADELEAGIKASITRNPLDQMLSEKLVERGMSLGFQDAYLTVAALESYKKRLRGVKLRPTGDMVRDLTMVKTPEEIAKIKKAAQIADKVYKDILGWVRPGMREDQVAAEISYRGRGYGSEGDAFDIIVASGPRGALPHGRASSKKIKKGELVTLDFGCIYQGFNSDMTRTFAVGNPSDQAREIYEIVLRAQKAGVKAARAGMTGKELDDVCRDIITEAGYGDQFGHSTGHGLGIEVHEMPAVAGRGNDQRLEQNMVVTIEPGIYIPGSCGVRIEDDVVIGTSGSTILNKSPKQLVIV